MRTHTITCDHCGEEVTELGVIIGFHDAFGMAMNVDLHHQCFAEFFEFCPQIQNVKEPA